MVWWFAEISDLFLQRRIIRQLFIPACHVGGRKENNMPDFTPNSRINPDLRYDFENLPIEVKNSLLEAGVTIETVEDLKQAAERFMQDAYY